MKKSVLTLSFLALFAVAANAQTKGKEKPAPKEQNTVVNDDGTISTKPAEKTEKKDQPAPKSGTRMAINQKGAPTSKSKNAKDETKKSENPGQPANTERKD